MSQIQNIPELRFPEFDGEWGKIKIGNISLKINSGKTPLGGSEVYTDKGVIFIRSQNINNDTLNLESITFIPESINETMKNSVVYANDILLNITGASLGRSCVVPNDFKIGNVNQHVCIIRLNSLNDPRFFQRIFSSQKGQNQFLKLQTGSGREGLNFESIKSIRVFSPTYSEQQKIATFLTSVDKRIQALEQKKEFLEQYKKGVMQKIFNREIRFQPSTATHHLPLAAEPTTQYKSNNSYPDWEVKKLGEIATITTGSSNREDSSLVGEYTFFDRSQDIRTSDRYLFDKEAIIFPGEGQKFVPKYFIGKFDLHQRAYAIFDFLETDGLYLYYLLSYSDRHLQSQAVGSTVKSLRLPMFKTMPINFPCLEEQQKIAGFLSAIDTKIEAVTSQIDHSKTFKKGLLQKMFV